MILKNNLSSSNELVFSLFSDGIRLTSQQFQKARNDDGETLYDVGVLYYEKKEYDKALTWFRRADSQSYSPAQNVIGWMYQYGYGVSKDYKEAMDWYLKAAYNDGNKHAQYSVGYLYQNSLGVPQNIYTAITWYTASANQYVAVAQYRLGQIYEDERAVRNLQKAADWYKKAADNWYENAGYALNRIKKQGYYPKSDQKVINDWLVLTEKAGSKHSWEEKEEKSVSTISKEESQIEKNQNNDDYIALLNEKLYKLEQKYQKRVERDKKRKKDFKSKLELLQHENAKMEEELNQLKSALDDNFHTNVWNYLRLKSQTIPDVST